MDAAMTVNDPWLLALCGLLFVAALAVGLTLYQTLKAPYTVIERPYRGEHYKLIAATYAALKTKRPISVHQPLAHIIGVSPKLKGAARRSATMRLSGITVPVVISNSRTLAAEMVLLERHWKQCEGEQRANYKVIDSVCRRAGIPVVYPLVETSDVAGAADVIVQAFKDRGKSKDKKPIPILDKRTSGAFQPMTALTVTGNRAGAAA